MSVRQAAAWHSWAGKQPTWQGHEEGRRGVERVGAVSHSSYDTTTASQAHTHTLPTTLPTTNSTATEYIVDIRDQCARYHCAIRLLASKPVQHSFMSADE